MEILKAIRAQTDILQTLMEQRCWHRQIYPSNLLIITDKEKHSEIKSNLNSFYLEIQLWRRHYEKRIHPAAASNKHILDQGYTAHSKRMGKIEEAGIAILNSDKTDFKTQLSRRGREEHILKEKYIKKILQYLTSMYQTTGHPNS